MGHKLELSINLGNDAFSEDPGSEVARLLRDLANAFERDGLHDRRILDINGNLVGKVETFLNIRYPSTARCE